MLNRTVYKLSFVSIVTVFLVCGAAIPQTAIISGIVRDSISQESLVGANVSLLGTSFGTLTAESGFFLIRSIPTGSYVVRMSLVGYGRIERNVSLVENDSIHLPIFLKPVYVQTKEIVITGTRTIHSIADVPIRVEAIPQEEIEEKLLMTPSSVAMLLNESTGMRVQTTSATSNTANLRIQGLSGRYTQILTDGVPNFGGMSAAFGLTQLLPLNIRQVEVIKGATSALYGADAIAGVVNFLTKEPQEEPEISVLFNATTQRGFDAAGFYSQPFDKLGTTLFLSKNNQALFDVDGDGYGDIAEFDRSTIAPKFIYRLSEEVTAKLSAGFLSEKRLGGAINAPRSVVGTGAPYLEEIKSQRFDLVSHVDWDISETRSISLKFVGMQLKRDAFYGSTPFNGTQSLVYLDGQYSFDVQSHNILVGTAFSLEDFKDRSPSTNGARSYTFNTPGLFAQDEFKLSERWTVVASGRLDIHNTYGTFFTPRLSLMYRPTTALTARLGGGTGFKAPTIFVEEAEEIGFKNVKPLQHVAAEKAWSASFDVNWRVIFDELTAVFNTALYYSRLDNALLADEDSLNNGILFLRNTTGATTTQGGEFSSKLTYGNFKISLGYTYIYATQIDGNNTYELPLNPRHSFGAVGIWASKELDMKVGLEQYWTGTARLERNPFRERSPAYWIAGAIAEKGFGGIRFFINFENIFDTRQTRFEPIIIGNPQVGNVRTLPIYAPLEGRVINGGIRFVL